MLKRHAALALFCVAASVFVAVRNGVPAIARFETLRRSAGRPIVAAPDVQKIERSDGRASAALGSFAVGCSVSYIDVAVLVPVAVLRSALF